jgi:O-antigen/teichoic acid export membrane protein
MAKSLRSLLKNVFSLVSANIIVRVLSLVFISFVARYLGVENFGKYTTILAFATIVEFFSRMGLMKIIVRDVAQDRSKSSTYISTATSILFITSVIGCMGVILVVLAMDYPSEMVKLTAIACVSMIFHSIQGPAAAVLRAHERMEILGVIQIMIAVFKCGAGILILKAGCGLTELIWLVVAINILGTVLYLSVVHKGFIPIRWSYDPSLGRLIIKEGALLFIINVLVFIRARADIILLSKLQGPIAVGFYGAAKRTIEYIGILRVGTIGALFPRLSVRWSDSPSSLLEIYEKVLRIFTVIYLPIAVGTAFFSREIIRLIYGKEYLEGAIALQILAAALLFDVMSGPASMVIIITKKNLGRLVPLVATITLLFILLNLFLIPKYGFVGSSVVVLISSILGLVIRLSLIRSLFHRRPQWLNVIKKHLLAAAITGFIFYWSRELGVFINVFMGGAAYLASLWLLGEFKREEYREIRNAAKIIE